MLLIWKCSHVSDVMGGEDQPVSTVTNRVLLRQVPLSHCVVIRLLQVMAVWCCRVTSGQLPHRFWEERWRWWPGDRKWRRLNSGFICMPANGAEEKTRHNFLSANALLAFGMCAQSASLYCRFRFLCFSYRFLCVNLIVWVALVVVCWVRFLSVCVPLSVCPSVWLGLAVCFSSCFSLYLGIWCCVSRVQLLWESATFES